MVKRYMSSHASQQGQNILSAHNKPGVGPLLFVTIPSIIPVFSRVIGVTLLPLELPDLIHKIVSAIVGDDLLKGGFTIVCKGATTMESTDVDKF